MRSIATDVWRGWSVGRSIMQLHPAKMAGPIEMLFGMWGEVGPSNHVDGGPDLLREGEILGREGSVP